MCKVCGHYPNHKTLPSIVFKSKHAQTCKCTQFEHWTSNNLCGQKVIGEGAPLDTHTYVLSLSLTHTLSHTHTLSLSFTYTLSHSHTLSLFHTLSLTHTHSLSLTYTLSLTHTHSFSHTHTHSHSHTLSLSLSLSL